MTDVAKALKPQESVIIAPLNEGTKYVANNFILFRISSAQLNMWIVNDSYITFDIKYTRQAAILNDNAGAACAMNKTYIRNIANVFKSVEVIYAGNTIYSQPYVVEQNNEIMYRMGDSYLRSHPATFTTRDTIINGTPYLEFDNGNAANGNNTIATNTATIKNVMLPVNQILPMFMDITSVGFPMRSLSSQLEIRLYINEPYRYLVDWRAEIKDFDYRCYINSDDATEKAKYLTSSMSTRYPNDKVEFSNVKMYCANYIADEPTAAQIDAKCGVNGSGEQIYRWYQIQTAIREVAANNLQTVNNLPFSITTNNEKSFLFYCYRTGYSPSLLYRPALNNVYIQFGSNQIPFQPINGSSLTNPYEYKFTVDDVLDNIDTYFTETNGDYNDSYRFIAANTARANIKVPTSSFIIMGANFSSDPSTTGIASSAWNSQYQATFNALTPDVGNNPALTFILSCRTEMGLVVKNGEIHTVNI